MVGKIQIAVQVSEATVIGATCERREMMINGDGKEIKKRKRLLCHKQ